jgi:hypothetical protein
MERDLTHASGIPARPAWRLDRSEALTMNARRAIGIALLVGGVLLLFFGMNAADSFASDMSEMMTGSPTDRSVWMLVLGAIAAVAGGILAVVPGG